LYGLICLGLSLFILFATLPKQENHITFERKIESLDFQEKGLYLKFVNDDTQYVFYEFNDIKYELINENNYYYILLTSSEWKSEEHNERR
jgi:hypothetical protein